jgi:hypothetical protein
VSFSALEQASKHCPELEKYSSISIEKLHEIMSAKIQQEREKFIKLYGNDGVRRFLRMEFMLWLGEAKVC